MTKTLVALIVALSFSSCAAMHHVTGDPLFAPEAKPVVRGPNVPDAEPTDDLLEQPPTRREPVADEDELAPLPAPMSKKKGTKVAAAGAQQ